MLSVLLVTPEPPIWPYVFTVLAVAVIPLGLAAIGGHLAVLALPISDKAKRRFIWGVWNLAAVGVLMLVICSCLHIAQTRIGTLSKQRY